MKQYESYKDSGVQWIGQIPSHWEYVKVSWVFPNIGSGTTPDTNSANYYAEEGINWLQTGDLNDGDIVETSKHITELALQERGLRIFPKGSLVIAMYGATIGKVGLLQIETTTNQACCVLPPSENMSISYTKYVLQSAKEVLLQQSIGGGQPNISQAIIKALNIPYPSLEEQRVIAAYLDHKVGQIDAVIAEKEAMVSDLTAYRSAVISEAVTRGLDKSVPLRDSGIDWIGQIPEHWSVVKLSWMYPNIGSGTTPDTSNPEYYSENGINWLQTGDLNDGEIVETSKHITEKAIQERGLKIYPAGSLVVAMYGATIGKVGILKIDTTTNQACCVLPPNEQMSNLYMKFVLQAAKEVLLQNSVGGGQPNISQAIIKALNIPLPAIKEQEEIAAYTQKKYIEMDTTLAELQAEIADLQSFKSAIITEAVTGKVDLRDWKPKTVTA